LKILHKDHEGIVRMKMAARSVFWWKNMNTDIEKFGKECEICDKTSNVNKEKVISKWPIAVKPWQRVHVDFFHLEGSTFLVIIDAYSKYVIVKSVKKTNCESLISVLQEVFAFFGLPEEIVSDNSPPFGSWLFNSYGNQSNIKITKTPPFHSQSNGLAERADQTVKKYFKKYILDKELSRLSIKEKVVRFITVYNTTPSTVTTQSPADRMFSYKLRSVMSSINPKSNITVNVKKKVKF